MAKLTKAQQQDQQEAREALLEILKPGATVYTSCSHVARSGMSRTIELCVPVVGGCGMDMGFAVVYDLGLSLWPAGTPAPHGTRNGEPDSNGGYALKHSWL